MARFLAYAPCCAFVAILTACGASQPPTGVSTGLQAERASFVRASDRFTAIYSFRGGSGDGAYPNGGLTVAYGVLYGTTAGGGPTGAGTIYEISPSGQESPIHIFAGAPDGDDPWPPPIRFNGGLYGTTAGGGANNLGAVFKIGRYGAERIVYSFQGGADGTQPIAGLMHYDGTLYGATLYGGANSDGTIFAIDRRGKERVLHSFGGSSDGENRYTTLTAYDGVL
jgi:uncharacterized repeat protein (TIGR03803 family)